MPYIYKQVELQKMEWCSRDTIRYHLDKYVPIYVRRGNNVSKRYLSREDSMIYMAGFEATRPQRAKAFCEVAFDEEFTWELPAVDMCIIWHYDQWWIFDKIYYKWEEVTRVNKITGLQSLLTKLKRECYPPLDHSKHYIQTFGEREIELFWIYKWKKRGYRKGSRIIIDWFGRKHR